MLTAILTIKFHTQHNTTTIAVRYGVWLRPNHHIKYTRLPSIAGRHHYWACCLLQSIVECAPCEGEWCSGSVSSRHSYVRQWTGCVINQSATHSSQFSSEDRAPLPTGGPQIQSRYFGEEINFLSLPTACNLGLCTVLTELSHLLSSRIWQLLLRGIVSRLSNR